MAHSMYTPFQITSERVRRLTLIANTKDFDEYYHCFEPQVHLLPDGSEAMVVIAYRQDYLVDVYHSPDINLNKEDYTVVQKGANELVETQFEKSKFTVDQFGLQLELCFQDLMEREIYLHIHEYNPKKPLMMNLLAPVGYGSENPEEMMLVFMHNFSFVRAKKSDIVVRIGGREIKPEVFIKPMGWLQYKYSSNSYVCKVCPNYSGDLSYIKDSKLGNNEYSLASDGSINRINVPIFEKELTMSFQPSFPNIANLRKGDYIDGEWAIKLNTNTGTVAGSYSVSTEDGKK